MSFLYNFDLQSPIIKEVDSLFLDVRKCEKPKSVERTKQTPRYLFIYLNVS